MNGATLLSELHVAGVWVELAGDRLRLDAPAGALTPERIARLRLHKVELIDALRCAVPSVPIGVPVGWTVPAWIQRLRQLASVCIFEPRKTELREWADRLENAAKAEKRD